jgi:hypothetical protein
MRDARLKQRTIPELAETLRKIARAELGNGPAHCGIVLVTIADEMDEAIARAEQPVALLAALDGAVAAPQPAPEGTAHDQSYAERALWFLDEADASLRAVSDLPQVVRARSRMDQVRGELWDAAKSCDPEPREAVGLGADLDLLLGRFIRTRTPEAEVRLLSAIVDALRTTQGTRRDGDGDAG